MNVNKPLQASDVSEDYRSIKLLANFTNLNWIIVGGVNTWSEIAAVPGGKTAVAVSVYN